MGRTQALWGNNGMGMVAGEDRNHQVAERNERATNDVGGVGNRQPEHEEEEDNVERSTSTTSTIPSSSSSPKIPSPPCTTSTRSNKERRNGCTKMNMKKKKNDKHKQRQAVKRNNVEMRQKSRASMQQKSGRTSAACQSSSGVLSLTDLAEQVSIAALGENRDQGEEGGGQSYKPNPMADLSIPGAYREGRESYVVEDRNNNSGNDASLVFGLSEEFQEEEEVHAPQSGSCNGLVRAQPVDLEVTAGTAHPLGASSAQDQESRQRLQEKHRSACRLQLVSLGVCFLILLVTVGLAIGFVAKRSSSNNETDSLTTTKGNQTEDALCNKEWTWDLPFNISNSTLRTLREDVNGTSPQSKAYQWMKQDPYYQNYTSEQLLERFVLVTLYFATDGENWEQQGGGNTTVTTDLTSSLALFSSTGPPPDKDGGGSPPPEGSAEPGGGTPPPANQEEDHGGHGRRLRRRRQERQLTQVSPPSPSSGGGPSPETIQVSFPTEKWLSYNHSHCTWFTRAPLEGRGLCGDGEDDDDDDDGNAEYFDLMQNNLQGHLPEELGLWTTLKLFKVGRNKIGGTIPSQFGALPYLTNLRLFTNQLTGTVPSQLGLLSNTLTEISFVDNQLKGRLPREIWNLSKLTQFRVGSNEFTGSMPANVGKRLSRVELFMMERNQFSGTLPPSLGLLTDVIMIHLGENQFTGTLPTELGQLQNVTRLFFEDNLLRGTIPSELGQLDRLKELKLDGNTAIEGTIPSELGKLNQTLTHLFLKGTAVTGTIPMELCGIFKLQFDCSPTLCGCDCECE